MVIVGTIRIFIVVLSKLPQNYRAETIIRLTDCPKKNLINNHNFYNLTCKSFIKWKFPAMWRFFLWSASYYNTKFFSLLIRQTKQPSYLALLTCYWLLSYLSKSDHNEENHYLQSQLSVHLCSSKPKYCLFVCLPVQLVGYVFSHVVMQFQTVPLARLNWAILMTRIQASTIRLLWNSVSCLILLERHPWRWW